MPSPVPAWFETDGTTPVTSLTFTGLVPGVLSAWQTVRLYNDQDGAASSDALLGRRLRALARTASPSPFVAEGHPLVDLNAVFVQILGGDATDAVPGGVQGLGVGSTLAIPSLASTEYVELRVAVRLPNGSTLTDADVAFALDPAAFDQLGDGGPLLGRGIEDGIGQRNVSALLKAFTATPNGSPDAFVNFTDEIGVLQGRPIVKLEGDQEFTNADGSAATLASGEAYAAFVSSNRTITKGNKATAPLTEANYPTLPDGHKLLAIVTRPFSGLISASEIQNVAAPIGFDYLGASGRVISVSGGRCAVGSNLAYVAGSLSIEITASTTEVVYLLGDGSLSLDPSAGLDAKPLWQFTADGSSITAYKDLRQFASGGAVRVLSSFLSGSSSGNKAYVALPIGPPISFHPLRAVRAVLAESDPSSLGASSGSWILEIKSRAIGAASFTTVFTSSGSDDRRPTLAESVTDPEFSAGLPEVLTFEGGSTLELSWSAIPTGGTPSAGAMVLLTFVEVP